jgi:hypothetical protein
VDGGGSVKNLPAAAALLAAYIASMAGAVTLAFLVTGLMFAALLLGGAAFVSWLADLLSGGDGDA